jgi:hypothetical protein
MDSEPGFETADLDAYVVHSTWRHNLTPLLILGALDLVLLYLVVTSPGPGVIFGLLVSGGMSAVAWYLIWRKIRQGGVVFAVDSRGLYLGSSGEAGAALLPWSWIVRVVTYDYVARTSNGGRIRRRYVGAELKEELFAEQRGLPRRPDLTPLSTDQQAMAKALLGPWLPELRGAPPIAARRIQGWRLDEAWLSAAVQRYAPGMLVEELPERNEMSGAQAAAAAWRSFQNVRGLLPNTRGTRKPDDDLES